MPRSERQLTPPPVQPMGWIRSHGCPTGRARRQPHHRCQRPTAAHGSHDQCLLTSSVFFMRTTARPLRISRQMRFNLSRVMLIGSIRDMLQNLVWPLIRSVFHGRKGRSFVGGSRLGPAQSRKPPSVLETILEKLTNMKPSIRVCA
jgi:hypothetical protein